MWEICGSETAGDFSCSGMMDRNHMENSRILQVASGTCTKATESLLLLCKVLRWHMIMISFLTTSAVYTQESIAASSFSNSSWLLCHFRIHFEGVYHRSLLIRWKEISGNSWQMKISFQNAIQSKDHASRLNQHILNVFQIHIITDTTGAKTRDRSKINLKCLIK